MQQVVKQLPTTTTPTPAAAAATTTTTLATTTVTWMMTFPSTHWCQAELFRRDTPLRARLEKWSLGEASLTYYIYILLYHIIILYYIVLYYIYIILVYYTIL